jgi:hypothetical protein
VCGPAQKYSGVLRTSVPGRQREIANVDKSHRDRTFARTTANDEVAPKAVIGRADMGTGA